MMVALWVCYTGPLFRGGTFPQYPVCWEFFHGKMLNFVKCFFCMYEMIIWFLYFILLNFSVLLFNFYFYDFCLILFNIFYLFADILTLFICCSPYLSEHLHGYLNSVSSKSPISVSIILVSGNSSCLEHILLFFSFPWLPVLVFVHS